MEYTNADVFMYQILDCLVTQYDYKIVNVPGSKNDIWVANAQNSRYPIIRLHPQESSTPGFEMEYMMKIRTAICMVINKEAKITILNTHEQSKEFAQEDVAQILVRDDYISDSALLKEFPYLEKALRKVENNQNECARLTRHLESAQIRKIKEARKFSFAKAPKVTMAIIAVCVAVFIAFQFVLLVNSKSFGASLVVGGVYYKALVVYAKEYWRLFTAGFIHYDIITLFFYMLALYQIGKVCEKVYSKKDYALIILGSMVIGNLFALIFDGNVIACGMGGGVFGALSALVVHLYSSKLYKNRLIRLQLSNLFFIVFIAFMIEATSPFMLLGGAAAGLFLSFITYPKSTLKPYRIHFILCFLMMLGMLGYFSAQQISAYPQNRKLDQAIVDEYEYHGFKKQSQKIERIFNKAYEE